MNTRERAIFKRLIFAAKAGLNWTDQVVDTPEASRDRRTIARTVDDAERFLKDERAARKRVPQIFES